ncbi:hypothetical protein Lal_00049062 [Lupinus albus]|nr:hypothetical protein Lal_00049062 [Lupinus albus]
MSIADKIIVSKLYMALKTRLSEILKPLNVDYGKVSSDWGTTPIMAVFMSLFFTFLSYHFTNL